MASAQGVWPALLLLAALFVVPPAVSLGAALRRAASLRRRGLQPSPWLQAGAVFAVGSIAVNSVVLALTLWGMGDGGLVLGHSHALAAFLAWVCFWIWVAILIFLRRRRQRAVY